MEKFNPAIERFISWLMSAGMTRQAAINRMRQGS